MLQVFGETLVTERMWMDGLIFLLDCCLCPISPACWDLAMYICGVSTLSPQVSFWREFQQSPFIMVLKQVCRRWQVWTPAHLHDNYTWGRSQVIVFVPHPQFVELLLSIYEEWSPSLLERAFGDEFYPSLFINSNIYIMQILKKTLNITSAKVSNLFHAKGVTFEFWIL